MFKVNVAVSVTLKILLPLSLAVIIEEPLVPVTFIFAVPEIVTGSLTEIVSGAIVRITSALCFAILYATAFAKAVAKISSLTFVVGLLSDPTQ